MDQKLFFHEEFGRLYLTQCQNKMLVATCIFRSNLACTSCGMTKQYFFSYLGMCLNGLHVSRAQERNEAFFVRPRNPRNVKLELSCRLLPPPSERQLEHPIAAWDSLTSHSFKELGVNCSVFLFQKSSCISCRGRNLKKVSTCRIYYWHTFNQRRCCFCIFFPASSQQQQQKVRNNTCW